MPKINVYLPDGLAERVRDARIPVSRICQEALVQALDGLGVTGGVLPTALIPEAADLDPPANSHVAQILELAVGRAAAHGHAEVGSAELLHALLDEEESIAVRFLELFGFPREQIRTALDAVGAAGEVGAAGAGDARAVAVGGGGDAGVASDDGERPRLGAAALAALEVGTAEAAAHGAPLTTVSHLLLGLLLDDGPAGAALRDAGVTDVVTPSLLAAFYHGVSLGRITLDRGGDDPWLRSTLTEISERLGRLEARG